MVIGRRVVTMGRPSIIASCRTARETYGTQTSSTPSTASRLRSVGRYVPRRWRGDLFRGRQAGAVRKATALANGVCASAPMHLFVCTGSPRWAISPIRQPGRCSIAVAHARSRRGVVTLVTVGQYAAPIQPPTCVPHLTVCTVRRNRVHAGPTPAPLRSGHPLRLQIRKGCGAC